MEVLGDCKASESREGGNGSEREIERGKQIQTT